MDKKISTFLNYGEKDTSELGLTDTATRSIKGPRRRGKLIKYAVCPICSMNRVLDRTGVYENYKRAIRKKSYGTAKGDVQGISDSKKLDIRTGKATMLRSRQYNPERITAFDKYDFENAPFISVREVMGRPSEGEQGGIVEVAIIRFKDISRLPLSDRNALKPLIEQIKSQCAKTIDYIESLGL